ncbi:glycosyltransferase family A protein [Winogradskyella sp.]|uniref:glycosyltransferase family 2 protein n=1 Tax=Winogradskyella sp. TaxID=1883156 RepID=UPI0025CFC932|nr:glycosyltransferase family A protein [Winogradskyella sp.]MCT4628390.1 glycosyltransferase family 2 protein [Winogradskyella sp.]
MRVSVVIPVYNAEKYIKRAVDSVIQLNEVKQIILVEDGSKDNSLLICKQLYSQFDIVEVYQHEKGLNKGAGASRNLGIQKASMPFVAFLDADDTYTAQRFLRDREVFDSNPNCDGAYGATGVVYLDKEASASWEKTGKDEMFIDTINKAINPNDLFEYLIGYKNEKNALGYFSIIALTLKRDRLLQSKVNFSESLKLHQDTVFMLQLAYCLKLYPSETIKPVSLRGVHLNNRFINNPNPKYTRSRQYKTLRDWAIDLNIKPEIIRYFNRNYLINFLGSKNLVTRLCLLVQKVMRDKNTRANLNWSLIKRLMKSK